MFLLHKPGTALSSQLTFILKVPALLGTYEKMYVEDPASRHEVSTSLPSSYKQDKHFYTHNACTKLLSAYIGMNSM